MWRILQGISHEPFQPSRKGNDNQELIVTIKSDPPYVSIERYVCQNDATELTYRPIVPRVVGLASLPKAEFDGAFTGSLPICL